MHAALEPEAEAVTPVNGIEQRVAQRPPELLGERSRGETVAVERRRLAEQLPEVAGAQVAGELAQPLLRRQAEGVLCRLRGDGALGEEQPLEQRLGVAHAAVRRTGHERERAGPCVDAGLVAQAGELALDLVVGEAPEPEVLAARQDGGGELLRLRGGEHEQQARRWLLERLEKRVGRRAAEHVRLVEHPNAHPAAQAGEPHLLPEVAHVLDRVVRGGVELRDVGMRPLLHEAARLAHAARAPRGIFVLAVDRHRQEARRGRLPDAARTREEVGVPRPAAPDGGEEDVLDMFLTHDLVETDRAGALVEGRHRAPLYHPSGRRPDPAVGAERAS